MKKVFLAVLAAGLFFACSNDTKDKAVEEPVTDEVEATVEEQPAQEATVETTVETPAPKKEEGVKVEGNKNGGVNVETENTKVEADKDGNVSLKINTKGTSSKGNR
jgi:ABC-type glycerol-3-phosphate transport system substrate-binding protein